MKKFDFSIVQTLRKKWGITAEELAGRADLTRATVTKIEGGGGNPTIETIEAISRVFQLTSSELIRMAETAQCEKGDTRKLDFKGFRITHIRFPDFEVYRVAGPAGARKNADPRHHENTAEVCLVLSGKIRATVGSQCHELGPGMAIRFKALHHHFFEVLEKAEFLLIHHKIV